MLNNQICFHNLNLLLRNAKAKLYYICCAQGEVGPPRRLISKDLDFRFF